MDVNNEYGVLDVQKDLLKLLKEFDHFCIANNIKYSVIGGTLLGAIRHKGFIPWDDDLDVFVDRENYRKLKNSLPSDKLGIDSRPNTSFWVDKLKFLDKMDDKTELVIDVFVLDNLPDNKLAAYLKINTLRFLQGMIKPRPRFSEYPIVYRAISILLWLLGRLFSKEIKLKLYHFVSVWGNRKETKSKMISNDEFGLLPVKYPYNIMNSTIRLSFENIEVSGISQYDRYLTLIYGDYMTPPNESERVPRHIV